MEMIKQIYQVTKKPLGQFEEVCITNGDTSCSFIPQFGSYLTDMVFSVGTQKINVIDGYREEAEFLKNRYYKSAFLLPFPNRLKGGQFQYKGKNYQFPLNEPENNNSIHGFNDFYKMEIVRTNLEGECAEVVLRHIYDGQNPAYPFPFVFTLTYRLFDNNSFECEIALKNTNDFEIPMGFGWHPYFKLGNSAKSLQLQLPAAQKIEINEFMLPTGKKADFSNFQTLETIGDTFLDTGFLLEKQTGKAELKLYSPELKTMLTYWQEADKFPFFQVYTPPMGESVAFEPMTCNINAFNNGEGLLELAPQATFSGTFGLKVEEYMG